MSNLTAQTLLNRLLGRGKLRHLQVMLQVAELGSLQRAGDAIGMTQSAVTQALAYVEKLLETPLYIRHARGVLPTPACVELLPVVRQVLYGLAQGAEALAAARLQGRHSLRLLASGSAINGILTHHIGRFVAHHPDIHLEVSEAEGEDLLLAISRKETDLVLCRRPAALPAGWEFQALLPDRFVVAAAPGDPMLRRRALSWSQLQGRRWLTSSVHTQARQRLESLSADWDHPPHYFPVVTRILPLTSHLIHSEKLLGFLPHSFARLHLDEGRLLELPVRADLQFAPLGLLRPTLAIRESAARLCDFLSSRLTPYGSPH